MEETAMFFGALADPTRLAIVMTLLGFGEACVCQLCRGLDIPQSMASRHLRILYHAGLLEKRRVKQWVHYSMRESDNPLVQRILKDLREVGSSAPEWIDVYARMRNVTCDMEKGGDLR